MSQLSSTAAVILSAIRELETDPRKKKRTSIAVVAGW
jgi:hypothetical protein